MEHSRETAESRKAAGTDAWRRHRRGVFRWTIALIVFVATLELAIRVDDRVRWGAPLVGAYSHSAMFGVDSIGWRPRAGASFEKWKINQRGFRGPEVTLSPALGVIRVVVLGASETFGQSESPGQEFPRQLERILNERLYAAPAGVRGFEVINAGVPGMSVGRIREYWNDWVSHFQPDIVLLYPSPGFYLANNPPADRNPRLEGTALEPPDSPRLPGKLRMVLNRFLPEELQAHLKRVLIERERGRRPTGWVWQETPDDRVALFTRHFLELVADLEADEVVPVLATHARAIEGPDDDWAMLVGWERFQPRAEGYVILDFEDAVNEAIEAIGARRDLPVARVHAAVPPEPGNFSDHQHFTDQGAELAADAMADVILGHLSANVTHRSTIRDDPNEVRGILGAQP